MKKILVVCLALALNACGGYDDMDAARLGYTGIGSSGSDNKPSGKSLWEYNQVGASKLAKINSLNTIPTSNEYNNALMSVQIHNFVNSQGEAKDYLTITILFADTDCATSCQLRYKKNGSTSGVYRVRQSISGVFNENSFVSGDMEKLIKAIQSSGKASISVPLIGVPDAEFEFDFSGYDFNKMKP